MAAPIAGKLAASRSPLRPSDRGGVVRRPYPRQRLRSTGRTLLATPNRGPSQGIRRRGFGDRLRRTARPRILGIILGVIAGRGSRTVLPAGDFDTVERPSLMFGNGPPVVRARTTLPTSHGRQGVRCAGGR